MKVLRPFQGVPSSLGPGLVLVGVPSRLVPPILFELMTSDRKLKASREGSK